MSVGQQSGGSIGSGASQGDAGKPADWDSLRDDVTGIADVAVERGRSFVDSAREQATTYVEQRKGAAAQSVTDLAKAIRDAGQPFEERPNIRAFFDTAAESLEQFAGQVQNRSLGDIYGEAEHLLRRHSGAALAATFVGGFLLSRFIKATGEGARHETRHRVAPTTGAGPRRPALPSAGTNRPPVTGRVSGV